MQVKTKKAKQNQAYACGQKNFMKVFIFKDHLSLSEFLTAVVFTK